MQRKRARTNMIFMLQVLYNSPLLLRGHFKWTQIFLNAFYLNTDDVIHKSRVVKALVSLSILSL